MNAITQFEDIIAWQKARSLTSAIYDCTKVGEFARDHSLKDQVRRAAVSCMLNIAEGFERGGTKEFIQFLATAKGSCAEVKAALYVALDQRYLTQTQFHQLCHQADEVSRLVAGFMAYLRSCGLKGPKFIPPTRPRPETQN